MVLISSMMADQNEQNTLQAGIEAILIAPCGLSRSIPSGRWMRCEDMNALLRE